MADKDKSKEQDPAPPARPRFSGSAAAPRPAAPAGFLDRLRRRLGRNSQ
jgi:hypothetical protein